MSLTAVRKMSAGRGIASAQAPGPVLGRGCESAWLCGETPAACQSSRTDTQAVEKTSSSRRTPGSTRTETVQWSSSAHASAGQRGIAAFVDSGFRPLLSGESCGHCGRCECRLRRPPATTSSSRRTPGSTRTQAVAWPARACCGAGRGPTRPLSATPACRGPGRWPRKSFIVRPYGWPLAWRRAIVQSCRTIQGYTSVFVDPGVRRDDDVFSTACVQVRRHLNFPRTAVGFRRNDDVFSSADLVKCGSPTECRFPRTAVRLRGNDEAGCGLLALTGYRQQATFTGQPCV
jgi:hypothetical protein